jgi:hypothetical protein
LARRGGELAQAVELFPTHRDIEVKHLGNHPRPAMDEVRPAILNLEVARRGLSPGLA